MGLWWGGVLILHLPYDDNDDDHDYDDDDDD